MVPLNSFWSLKSLWCSFFCVWDISHFWTDTWSNSLFSFSFAERKLCSSTCLPTTHASSVSNGNQRSPRIAVKWCVSASTTPIGWWPIYLASVHSLRSRKRYNQCTMATTCEKKKTLKHTEFYFDFCVTTLKYIMYPDCLWICGN